MQYSETGLPQDQEVLKAFMMYSKSLEQAQPATRTRGNVVSPDTSEDPLRTAQVMADAGAQDPQALSLALLRSMPQETFGLVEKRFPGMTEAIKEAALHNKTSYAYISEASDKVKLLSMATAIVTFERFRKDAEKAQEMFNRMSSGEKVESGELMIPVIPDMRVYDKLSDALFDKTSSPELETAFRERLSDFRYAADRLRGMILESGVASQLPPQMAAKLQQQPDGGPRLVFDDTELLDDPKVRAAFDVIHSHPLVSAEAFEAALQVGTILTKHQTGLNSTAVAAGLVLTGLRDFKPEDIAFLKKKLDWDVLELLQNYGGEKDLYPEELRGAPSEFKQFLLANTVAALGRMKEGAGKIREAIEQQPDIPEQMRPVVLSENLERMLMMSERMEDMMFMLGKTGAPHLEELFSKTLKETRGAIAENMPKVPKALPPPGFGFRRPPAPPKPPGGGQNFDLD